jgi:hypothetical protein
VKFSCILFLFLLFFKYLNSWQLTHFVISFEQCPNYASHNYSNSPFCFDKNRISYWPVRKLPIKLNKINWIFKKEWVFFCSNFISYNSMVISIAFKWWPSLRFVQVFGIWRTVIFIRFIIISHFFHMLLYTL